jgi:hypothetical protein
MKSVKVKRNVVYIGERFYRESGTMMSSVFEIIDKKYYRTDWGKISIALDNGQNITIRPATKKEIEYFEEMLLRYLKKTEEAE